MNVTMPLRNYMIAHKEKKSFHPQKHIAHSIKISRGFCINKLYLSLYLIGPGLITSSPAFIRQVE